MREGWQKKTLGEILTLEYGKPLSPSARNIDGKYPVYGANGIKDRSDKFYFDKPSIIVGRKGSAGEITLTEDKFWPLDVTYFVTFDHLKYDLRFLYHLLSLQELTKLAKGVKPGINRNEVYAKSVRVPLLPEQQRIVVFLEDALAGLATATANVEKNLYNARGLFESVLNATFEQGNWPKHALQSLCNVFDDGDWIETKDQSSNGIRLIQTGNIGEGEFKDRGEKARFVSEATFQRLNCTEIFEGDCLVSRLPDPVGRACLLPPLPDRTITAVDCTIVRFKKGAMIPEFFVYYSQSRAYATAIEKQTMGATRQRISRKNLGEVLVPLATLRDQKKVVEKLADLQAEVQRLLSLYGRHHSHIHELKQSILQKAFSGGLTDSAKVEVASATASVIDMRRKTALAIALAYERHRRKNRDQSFGHTKEQKILHMIEAEAGFDLGRKPIRDAAGPNDFHHMLDAEEWAEANHYFKVSERAVGGYQFKALVRLHELVEFANSIDPVILNKIERVVDAFIPMDMQEAEVFATAYAAWNNLIIEGSNPTDDEIIEACYAWHPKKSEIPRAKFMEGLLRIRDSNFVPRGRARFVPPPAQGQLAL